jgi:hypothetical protein
MHGLCDTVEPHNSRRGIGSWLLTADGVAATTSLDSTYAELAPSTQAALSNIDKPFDINLRFSFISVELSLDLTLPVPVGCGCR